MNDPTQIPMQAEADDGAMSTVRRILVRSGMAVGVAILVLLGWSATASASGSVPAADPALDLGISTSSGPSSSGLGPVSVGIDLSPVVPIAPSVKVVIEPVRPTAPAPAPVRIGVAPAPQPVSVPVAAAPAPAPVSGPNAPVAVPAPDAPTAPALTTVTDVVAPVAGVELDPVTRPIDDSLDALHAPVVAPISGVPATLLTRTLGPVIEPIETLVPTLTDTVQIVLDELSVPELVDTITTALDLPVDTIDAALLADLTEPTLTVGLAGSVQPLDVVPASTGLLPVTSAPVGTLARKGARLAPSTPGPIGHEAPTAPSSNRSGSTPVGTGADAARATDVAGGLAGPVESVPVSSDVPVSAPAGSGGSTVLVLLAALAAGIGVAARRGLITWLSLQADRLSGLARLRPSFAPD